MGPLSGVVPLAKLKRYLTMQRMLRRITVVCRRTLLEAQSIGGALFPVVSRVVEDSRADPILPCWTPANWTGCRAHLLADVLLMGLRLKGPSRQTWLIAQCSLGR